MSASPKPISQNPDLSATGCSQNNAVLISSDDESDFSGLDSQTGTSFPSIDKPCQLAERKYLEAGVAGM